MMSPCKDCKNRSMDCHGRCSRYEAYKSNIEDVRKIKKRERDINYFTSGHHDRVFGGIVK